MINIDFFQDVISKMDEEIGRPIKIIEEPAFIDMGETSMKPITYYKTLKDILYNSLQNVRFKENLSRQQYHSEKGKIRKGYLDQVSNFLKKHGLTQQFIDHELSEKHESYTFNITTNFYCPIYSGEFVITLDKN